MEVNTSRLGYRVQSKASSNVVNLVERCVVIVFCRLSLGLKSVAGLLHDFHPPWIFSSIYYVFSPFTKFLCNAVRLLHVHSHHLELMHTRG